MFFYVIYSSLFFNTIHIFSCSDAGAPLRLTIGDVGLEDFILSTFRDLPLVVMIALKLPVNYDNAYLKAFALKNDFTYQFFTKNLRKMTLTLLKRL